MWITTSDFFCMLKNNNFRDKIKSGKEIKDQFEKEYKPEENVSNRSKEINMQSNREIPPYYGGGLFSSYVYE